MRFYSTVGSYGGNQGTYLVRAGSERDAKKKLTDEAHRNKYMGVDIVDLAYVSDWGFGWTSVRRLIDKIKKDTLPEGSLRIRKDIYFFGPLEEIRITQI